MGFAIISNKFIGDLCEEQKFVDEWGVHGDAECDKDDAPYTYCSEACKSCVRCIRMGVTVCMRKELD